MVRLPAPSRQCLANPPKGDQAIGTGSRRICIYGIRADAAFDRPEVYDGIFSIL